MVYALRRGKDFIEFDRANFVRTSAKWGVIEGEHTRVKGMGQIGERVTSTTLGPRTGIEFVGHIKAISPEDMRAKKDMLYRVCDPCYPFIAMPNPETQIECYALETPKFSDSMLLNNNVVAQFVIDAAAYDPLFRDVRQSVRKNHVNSLATTVFNNGHEAAGLEIVFSAAATVQTPVLTNTETGEFIKLDRSLQAGETVTISTLYGKKSVVSSISGDAMSDLDTDSTFLQAPVGVSTFLHSATSGATSMTTTIKYYQYYRGV